MFINEACHEFVTLGCALSQIHYTRPQVLEKKLHRKVCEINDSMKVYLTYSGVHLSSSSDYPG